MNDALHISSAGLDLVKHFESCELTAYRDEAGVLTIGWGHTSVEGGIQVTKGMTITQEQADAALVSDMVAHETRVKRFCTQPLSQCQFDALVSFDFNTGGLMLGTASVKARFEYSMLRDRHAGELQVDAMNFKAAVPSPQIAPSTLLRKVNANDPFAAAEQFSLWVHAGGRVLAGLVRRRNAERDLFCNFGWERWKQ